jgi:raffinose/stachyose/melibiose transport system permease protein
MNPIKKRIIGLCRIPIMLLIGVVYLSPIYILIGVAFKAKTDTSSYWIAATSVHVENFINAVLEGKILLGIRNSAIITVVSVLLITFIGALAAYPLTRRRTRFNLLVKGFTMAIMMVPPLSILVPLYSTLISIHGVNTFWGIMIILVTFELPLSVFLYSNFIAAIPTALDEAAAIDGCSPARTFLSIILPQLKPVTVSVIILTGVHCWNDYQFSLYILQSPDLKTITLSISSFFSQTTSDIHAAAAAALLAILPVILIFIFLQKYFIKGMIDSAIK